VTVPTFAPMLASSARGGRLEHGWLFEPKLDGWRAMVRCYESVTVRTRNGHDITSAVPELAVRPGALDGRQVVLDGELVAGAGRPEDFYGIAGRVASRRRVIPLTFVAFDVLFLDGEVLCDRPYVERRAVLDELRVSGGSWATVPSFDGDADEVFLACAELGLEGLVAKRASSRYRPGQRSSDWLKLKTTAWRQHHAHRRHEHVPARQR
jgi:bifunctional non-homologous end joining protein LigD